MLIIGYGIFAILVIVILIVVNVRASRRTEDGDGEEKASEMEPAGNAPEEERAAEAGPAEEAGDPVEEEPKPAAGSAAAAGRSESRDRTYRQALRQLRTGPERADVPPPARKEDRIMSDSEYRKAMQNFRKRGDRQE